MKYWFIVGTAAELIKMYPVIKSAEERGLNWDIIQSGQSNKNFWKQAQDFNLPKTKIKSILGKTEDLKRSSEALKWFLSALTIGLYNIKKLVRESRIKGEQQTFLVHGDTLTTLVGALVGRILDVKLVHVEAGMRSGNFISPFPEEICRRLVTRLVDWHMCPDTNAQNNLMREGISKGVVVTNSNTVVDALQLAGKTNASERPYVIFNIHRFENLHSDKSWNRILDLIFVVAKKYRVVFVLMPSTREKIDNDGIVKMKIQEAGIELKDRLPFMEFCRLLNACEFIVTDGGSNQQECHYLGKPCLIMRNVTESIEGINGCCVLSCFQEETIQNFIENYEKFKRPTAFPEKRPTDIIWESILK